MSGFQVLGLLFLLGGLIALLALPVHVERARRLRRHGVRTTGRVFDHVTPGKVRRVGAEFVDQRGQTVSLTLHRLDMPNAGVLAVGKQFDVVYLPASPANAQPAKLTPQFHRRGLYRSYVLLGLHLERIFVALISLLFVQAAKHGHLKEVIKEYRLRRLAHKHGIQTQATVMWHEHNERKARTRPLIEYADQDGRTRSFEADTRKDPIILPIGRETPVTYDPSPSWTYPADAPVASISDEIPSSMVFFYRFLVILIVLSLGAFLLQT